MVKRFYISGGICFMIILANLTGCRKPADIHSSPVKPEVQILDQTQVYPTERIKIVHLFKDTVYTLSQPFSRQSGEELLIDEGTLIKVNISGVSGGTTDAGITIYPGGIIKATGTRSDPIIFTSNDYTGNQKANWNGLIIKGHSTDNSNGAGGDPEDFSGILSYCRIEFAPLVLTAVGNKTVIDHVQVSYANPSSSFEFDGGTFDAQNLISYACGGPGDFYITRGYQGKMQNLLAYRHPFFGATGNTPVNTIAGLIIENNPDPSTATSATPFTFPVISNLSVIGPDTQKGSSSSYSDTNLISAAMLTTRSTFFAVRNSLFLGFPAAGWYLNDGPTAENFRDNISEFSHCLVQAAPGNRAFYLSPEVSPQYNSTDFTNHVLESGFSNRVLNNLSDFKLKDPFNYDLRPDPFPSEDSPVFTGAGFDGEYFSNSFFNRTNYIGALGTQDWLAGWSNFLPLKTNYNFPN